MKVRGTLSFAALLVSLSNGAVARADGPIIPRGSIIGVDVKEIFVPNGFDDNDDVVIVLDGTLPDTCDRITANKANFDPATKSFYVMQFARRFNTFCIPDPVPFWTEVHLGQVKAGSFAVTARGSSDERIQVKAATSANPDDFLYAPIESAHVERDQEGPGYIAHLVGRFMNTCMQLDQIRVQNSGKTIEVMPVAKMSLVDDCRQAEVPFDWTVRMPNDLAAGRHLLHVRSLNGKAVNFMFSVAADATNGPTPEE